MAEGSLTLSALSGVREVSASDWDRLAHDAPPFVEHGFLAALEESGCVGRDSGWIPVPVIARDGGGRLVGAAPAYLKTHSMGEFVYDWAWADAAQRAGVRYYPKLVVAAPFSPVAGPRLLVDPDLGPQAADHVRRALLAGLVEVARERGATGVHVLFCTSPERALAEELGLAGRTAMQFHWDNEGYADFDAFLGRFRSKRRNQIRRERRRVVEAGLEVRCLPVGDAPPELREPAWRWYLSTIQRFHWGRQYLNEAFFDRLFEELRPRLQLTVAHHRAEPVAGTVNLQKDGVRWGRYWGADARWPFLHFEVTGYAPIEDAIERGLVRFEAGQGGGSHKLGRGLLPTLTHSVHLHLHDGFHEALAAFCAQEHRHVAAEAEALRERIFVRRAPQTPEGSTTP